MECPAHWHMSFLSLQRRQWYGGLSKDFAGMQIYDIAEWSWQIRGPGKILDTLFFKRIQYCYTTKERWEAFSAVPILAKHITPTWLKQQSTFARLGQADWVFCHTATVIYYLMLQQLVHGTQMMWIKPSCTRRVNSDGRGTSEAAKQLNVAIKAFNHHFDVRRHVKGLEVV